MQQQSIDDFGTSFLQTVQLSFKPTVKTIKERVKEKEEKANKLREEERKNEHDY